MCYISASGAKAKKLRAIIPSIPVTYLVGHCMYIYAIIRTYVHTS